MKNVKIASTYTWPAVHQKINDYLKLKEDSQESLIQTLMTIGIEVSQDEDASGPTPLAEIDPFTFYRHLYKHGGKKRLQFLQKLASHIGIEEKPVDTSGIPSAQAQKTWLFGNKKDRKDTDIPLLWELFQQATIGRVDNNLFQKCLNIKGVAHATITEALFMVNPAVYLPINGPVKTLCKKHGIKSAFATYEAYMTIVTNIQTELETDLVDISNRASQLSGSSKVWKIGSSDGEEDYSSFMIDNDLIAIGWSILGDLRQRKTDKSAIQEALLDMIPSYGKRVATRKAGEILSFFEKAKIGDKVILMRGQKALKVGIIDGDYFYDGGHNFGHQRQVRWLPDEVGSVKISEQPNTTFVRLKENPLTNNQSIEDNFEESVSNTPLNQILYGPPGTGKTYQTIEEAVKIIDSSFQYGTRSDLKNRYQELVDEGHICFTTFHQSLSYEDFIEGLKPFMIEDSMDVGYRLEPGLLYKMAIEASYSMIERANVSKVEQTAALKEVYWDYTSELSEKLTKESEVTIPSRSGGKLIVDSISSQDNLIIRHQGSEKTYTVSLDRLLRLDEGIPDLAQVKNIDKEFRKVIGGSNSSAYWAVLNQLRSRLQDAPIIMSQATALTFEDKETIVQQSRSSDYTAASGQPYVMIIDEVNRGNVSSIFGELITLLEEDKRLGKEENISIDLAYSKTKFSLPPNLYIIGTMNTADRSVEALDTALRRRFSFIEMLPDSNIVDEQESGSVIEGISLKDVLDTINNRIETLLSQDHLIGHSYFLGLRTPTDLKDTFVNKVIPLLQEYFYNDYYKLLLVLGPGFVEKQSRKSEASIFAIDNPDVMVEEESYYLKSLTGDFDIVDAVSKLLRIDD